MRALRFSRHGEPLDVLHLDDVPVPQPGPGEVRIRITHRPINPSDLLTIRGLYPNQPSLPGSPGLEGVGVVDAIGDGVTNLSLGQRVISLAGLPGTWAEQVVIHADRALAVPDAVSDQVAAQVLVNPVTAWAMLHDELALTKGDWLLQTAASSTLGHLVVQLAKHRGIRTISVVRRRAQAQPLLDAGADAVVCTEDESLVERVRAITGGRGVRGAIDAVSGPQDGEVAKCLAAGGTMLTMGVLGGVTLGPIDAGDLLFKGATIRGFWLTNWFMRQSPESVGRALTEVLTLLATGVMKPVVEAEYDLADFRSAIAHAERPGRSGKVLLRG
jgi:NADPH:quinone reductase-like Zn-dependent oxidoreductase